MSPASVSQSSTASALSGLSGPEAAACWTVLVERHGPDLWRLIASRSRDTHDAEDAYQDFWMGLPRAAAGFRPATGGEPASAERSARAWLMRVAYTSAIDHGRRRRSIQASAVAAAASRSADMDAHDPRTSGSGPLGHEPVAPALAPRPDTEDLADRSLLMARVQSAIGTLPEAYRRPLLLHLVAGLSYDDLAADLRCTVNHARVKVHRGMKRLRELLGVDEGRLPERSLAGLIVPLTLAMPAAPPLPPPAFVPPAPPPGTLGAAVKAVSFVAIGAGVAGAMALAALAVKADPPPPAPAVAPAPPAETVLLLDDFERADLRLTGHGHHDIRPELGLVPVPPGGGSGQGFRFAWVAGHSGWIDCEYAAPRRLVPELTPDVAGTVTMRVWCDGGAEVQHVAVRFTDRDGEMFEWRRPLPDAGKAGWRDISFPLALLTPADWDMRPLADHKADVPLTFWGYAVQLDTRLGRRPGTLIIDDVVLTIRR
jgi:RNA polymerase sigma factor (sigma-70 family)